MMRCLFKAATLSGSTLGRLRSKSSRVPWKRREMKCLLAVSRICTYFLKSVSFFKRLLSKIEPISLIIPRGDLTSVRMSPWNPWGFIEMFEINRNTRLLALRRRTFGETHHSMASRQWHDAGGVWEKGHAIVCLHVQPSSRAWNWRLYGGRPRDQSHDPRCILVTRFLHTHLIQDFFILTWYKISSYTWYKIS